MRETRSFRPGTRSPLRRQLVVGSAPVSVATSSSARGAAEKSRTVKSAASRLCWSRAQLGRYGDGSRFVAVEPNDDSGADHAGVEARLCRWADLDPPGPSRRPFSRASNGGIALSSLTRYRM